MKVKARINEKIKAGFGERLASLLVERECTRAALSKASGVSYDEIVKLIRGERMPTFSTMHRLADALGVTIPELLWS